tara:strand:- start:22 stop:360 length:339 start_codon:yes stop_codon:yes gene_type:complete
MNNVSEVANQPEMSEQSLYLTLDYDNGFVMGVGRKGQENQSTDVIVLEEAVVLPKDILPDSEAPGLLFQPDRVKSLCKDYFENKPRLIGDDVPIIDRSQIIFQFITSIPYLN